MKNVHKYVTILCFLLLLNFCNHAQTQYIRAFPNLSFSNPIDIQSINDNTNRLFVVSQTGIINVFENNSSVSTSSIFLDIKDRVAYGGEKGLLGLAFHPDYLSNGYFFVNYTTNNPLRTVISRFSTSTENIDSADKLSEQILLEVEQPFENHNGGQIAFGNDGYLYISLGDGGSGGDPGNRAQNLSTLLGKILRINIDNKEGEKGYSIPSDNPFVGNSQNILEEIFAYGLRNVWRFSFDGTGRLWAADVGQNSWEEINIIENGRNYGWRIMEGFHCFNPSSNCDQSNLTLPIWEYDHSSSGGYSITGGYLYEGINAPDIINKYIYGDFINGNIWAFNPLDKTNVLMFSYGGLISTFGIDQNKDLYFADHSTGEIYKFIDNGVNYVNSVKELNFKLDQNYPNPFNPTTIIKYSVPNEHLAGSSAKVILRINDVLGNEISTLVNTYQKPGDYQIEFNAENISAGVYFYTLNVNTFFKTKKMILLN